MEALHDIVLVEGIYRSVQTRHWEAGSPNVTPRRERPPPSVTGVSPRPDWDAVSPGETPSGRVLTPLNSPEPKSTHRGERSLSQWGLGVVGLGVAFLIGVRIGAAGSWKK